MVQYKQAACCSESKPSRAGRAGQGSADLHPVVAMVYCRILLQAVQQRIEVVTLFCVHGLELVWFGLAER